MKNNSIILCAFILILTFSSCLNCIGDGQSHYGFTSIQRFLVIENPQNQYHVNDTLWVSLKVPSFFYGEIEGIPCTINTSELSLTCDNLYLYSSTDSIEYSYSNNYELLYLKKGSFNEDFRYLVLVPEDDFYIITFGVLLDNTAIHSFGSNKPSIMLRNSNYKEKFCGSDAKCQYDAKGFYLPINFSNNEKLKFSFTVVP